MAKLTCRCLNVALHCKDERWAPVAGERVVPTGHRLRQRTLHEVELAVAGVTAEHPTLLQSEAVGDWMLQSCSNCDCDISLSHRQKSRVLVCPGLLSNEQDVAQVKGHPHYSIVFRIYLNPDLEREEGEGSGGRPRASSMSFGRDDPVIRQLHTQVRQFLADEEQEMEQRIRDFERREKETFARLQRKTLTHRTLLCSAISKAIGGVASSSPHSHPPQFPPSPSNSIVENLKQQVTITLHDPRPTPNNKPVAEDALFSLDGFDDEEEVDGEKGGVAFPQSDDEESGTDDSSYRDLSSVQAAIASSVPLSVPLFQPQPPQLEEGEPADMASSIKALALSVQNTGVFGDLPRPRVNSATRYR